MLLVLAPTARAFVTPGLSTPTQKQQQQQQHRSASPIIPQATTTTTTTSLSAVAGKEEDVGRDAEMVFSIIDVDGNGFISRKEMVGHLSKSGYTTEVINKIFAKLDVNADNEVSLSEFKEGLKLMGALRSAPGLGNYNSEFVKEIHEDADALFRSVDADRNGGIDEDELKDHINRNLSKYSEDAIGRIFKSIDSDGNGKISQEELRDAFVRYSALRQALGEGPNFK